MKGWQCGLVAWAFFAACSGAIGAPPVPERVTIESLDRDAVTGKHVVIHALLFKPGATDSEAVERRPAVIALHGCGGMYSALASRRDRLSLRHQTMAELLVAEGYVVLYPDSFRSRGTEEICTLENRRRSITQRHRRGDVQGALRWLQARSDVRADRIAVLGWSHGGSAVLATVNAKQDEVALWRERTPATPYFRAAVAFYPGCVDSLRSRVGYSLAAPLTLFVGGSDDWTAPQPCVDLVAKLAAGGEPATITVYPDAYHGFDGPSSQKRLRLDVPNGVHPGQGVTVATDPKARDDAYAKLKLFLRERLFEARAESADLIASAAGRPLLAHEPAGDGTEGGKPRKQPDALRPGAGEVAVRAALLQQPAGQRLQDAGAEKDADVDHARRDAGVLGAIDLLRHHDVEDEAGDQQAHQQEPGVARQQRKLGVHEPGQPR